MNRWLGGWGALIKAYTNEEHEVLRVFDDLEAANAAASNLLTLHEGDGVEVDGKILGMAEKHYMRNVYHLRGTSSGSLISKYKRQSFIQLYHGRLIQRYQHRHCQLTVKPTAPGVRQAKSMIVQSMLWVPFKTKGKPVKPFEGQ